MNMRRAEKAAAKRRQSQEALELAIREVHSQGASLRDIAKTVGLSHEQVRRIVQRSSDDHD